MHALEAASRSCSLVLQSCLHQRHSTDTRRGACQHNTSLKRCVPQVLSKALEVWDLQCIPQEAPDMATARQHPEREQAFICNLQVRCPVTVPSTQPVLCLPHQQQLRGRYLRAPCSTGLGLGSLPASGAGHLHFCAFHVKSCAQPGVGATALLGPHSAGAGPNSAVPATTPAGWQTVLLLTA